MNTIREDLLNICDNLLAMAFKNMTDEEIELSMTDPFEDIHSDMNNDITNILNSLINMCTTECDKIEDNTYEEVYIEYIEDFIPTFKNIVNATNINYTFNCYTYLNKDIDMYITNNTVYIVEDDKIKYGRLDRTLIAVEYTKFINKYRDNKFVEEIYKNN